MERQRSWFPYQKRKWRNASAGLCKAVNWDRNNGKVLLASRKLRFNKLTSSSLKTIEVTRTTDDTGLFDIPLVTDKQIITGGYIKTPESSSQRSLLFSVNPSTKRWYAFCDTLKSTEITAVILYYGE